MQDHLTAVLRPGLPERVYEDGELLLRQGEQGTFMMYILEGQVEVTVRLQLPREGITIRYPHPPPPPLSGPYSCINCRSAFCIKDM